MLQGGVKRNGSALTTKADATIQGVYESLIGEGYANINKLWQLLGPDDVVGHEILGSNNSVGAAVNRLGVAHPPR